MLELQPIELSKALARAEEARRAFVIQLREAPEADATPLQLYREVLDKEIWDQVAELPELDPLKEPLRRWLVQLIDARVNQPWSIARSREWRSVPRAPLDNGETGRTLAELQQLALSHPERANAVLQALAKSLEQPRVAATTLWHRRHEMASRLGIEDLASLYTSGTTLVAESSAWLSDTQELFTAPKALDFGGWLEASLAHNAQADWPARINEQVMIGWFRRSPLLVDVEPELSPLPRRLSPASFARLLESFGTALHEALAPVNQPFVVARDPLGVAGHSYGALFAWLLLDPAFAARELGVQRTRFADYRRVLLRMWLHETRRAAIAVQVRQTALTSAQSGALTARELLSAEWRHDLGPEAALALVGTLDQAPARFAALLGAAAWSRRLRAAHDEDWYRNPRAGEQLRAEAERPPQCELSATAVAEDARELAASLQHEL